jgi:hypothetical protein
MSTLPSEASFVLIEAGCGGPEELGSSLMPGECPHGVKFWTVNLSILGLMNLPE